MSHASRIDGIATQPCGHQTVTRNARVWLQKTSTIAASAKIELARKQLSKGV